MPRSRIRQRWGWVLLFTLVVGVSCGAWVYFHDPVRRIPRLRAELAELALQEARETGDQELEILAALLEHLPLAEQLSMLKDGEPEVTEEADVAVLAIARDPRCPLACELALHQAVRDDAWVDLPDLIVRYEELAPSSSWPPLWRLLLLLQFPREHPDLFREARQLIDEARRRNDFRAHGPEASRRFASWVAGKTDDPLGRLACMVRISGWSPHMPQVLLAHALTGLQSLPSPPGEGALALLEGAELLQALVARSTRHAGPYIWSELIVGHDLRLTRWVLLMLADDQERAAAVAGELERILRQREVYQAYGAAAQPILCGAIRELARARWGEGAEPRLEVFGIGWPHDETPTEHEVIEALAPRAGEILAEVRAELDRETPFCQALARSVPLPEALDRELAFTWVEEHADDLRRIQVLGQDERLALVRLAAGLGLLGGDRLLYYEDEVRTVLIHWLVDAGVLQEEELRSLWDINRGQRLWLLGLLAAAGDELDLAEHQDLLPDDGLVYMGVHECYLLRSLLRRGAWLQALALTPRAEAGRLRAIVVTAVELLRAETGQDLGFDLEAWRAWLLAQGEGGGR
jgi:hypothetical protein